MLIACWEKDSYLGPDTVRSVTVFHLSPAQSRWRLQGEGATSKQPCSDTASHLGEAAGSTRYFFPMAEPLREVFQVCRIQSSSQLSPSFWPSTDEDRPPALLHRQGSGVKLGRELGDALQAEPEPGPPYQASWLWAIFLFDMSRKEPSFNAKPWAIPCWFRILQA